MSAKAKASCMDPEFGQFFRVTGAKDADEAIAEARTAWPDTFGKDLRYALDDDAVPEMVVESSGWRRCQPCICGLEHRYDLFTGEPHTRGASFTYLIGLAR